MNGGDCVINNNGVGSCKCKSSYSGITCDECKLENFFKFNLISAFLFQVITTSTKPPISNFCSINPCSNHGICQNTNTGYTCQCQITHTGQNCTIFRGCLAGGSYSCLNGGRCVAGSCICSAGHYGITCEC